MKKASIFFSFWLMLLSIASQAVTMKHIGLEQLSEKATLIFYGKAINNHSEVDEQSAQIVTYTTFEIIDLIKGHPISSYTIKQLGGRLPDTQITQHVPGVPRFETNSEYIVFLPTPSKLGFCTPLGFQQGSFNIQTINNEKIITKTLISTKSSSTNAKTNQTAVINDTPSLPHSKTIVKKSISHSNVYLDEFIEKIRRHTQK